MILPKTDQELTQWKIIYADLTDQDRMFSDVYLKEHAAGNPETFDQAIDDYITWVALVQETWPELVHWQSDAVNNVKRLYLSNIPIWLRHHSQDLA